MFVGFLAFGLFAGSVSAVINAVTPSTNDINRTNSWAHVDQASVDVGEVTLNFIQPRSFLACFEYRTDGNTDQRLMSGGVYRNNYNPAVTDGLYPFYCQNNNSSTHTINANEYVEIRMVFGAETDERFDWTRFDVLPNPDLDGDGVLNENDLCADTTVDGLWDSEKGWGTNRWQVMDESEFGWYQNKPAKKGETIATYEYDMAYTYGCNGHQILTMLKDELGDVMNGHWKYGLSSSVLEDLHMDMSDGVLDGRYLLGTYEVPVRNGTGINTDFSPVSGMTYYLEASGTYRFMGSGEYGIADAEWANRNDVYKDNPFLNPEGWTLGENTYGSPTTPPKGGLDILVDNTNIYWGDFNSGHVYNYTYSGTGLPINFSIWDSAYGDNSQIDLTVKVYADIP